MYINRCYIDEEYVEVGDTRNEEVIEAMVFDEDEGCLMIMFENGGSESISKDFVEFEDEEEDEEYM